MADYTKMNEELTALGFAVTWVFVPFSVSRNFGELQRSLNWNFMLTYKGRICAAGPYSAGAGLCPSARSANFDAKTGARKIYRASAKANTRRAAMIYETETGRDHSGAFGAGKHIPAPSLAELVNCIILDSDAVDYATFEEWASDYGYTANAAGPYEKPHYIPTYAGRKLYDSCMETGLKFVNTVPESVRFAAAEIVQDI